VTKCWVRILGSCSNIQSREHYLSQGLWEGDSITVKGLWEEERTVGLSSLTTKNLCKKHNELLSPLDSEAKKIFRTISELYRLQGVRLKLKPSKFWTVRRYRVSGSLFERWAAKFIVGFFYVFGKDKHWHLTQTGPLEPPSEIVEAIFGHRQFKKPMGLYLVYDVGDRHYHEDGINLEPLFYPDGHGLVEGILEFKGFRFLLWLGGNDLSSFNIPTSEGRIFGPDGSELMYHPKDCRFTISKILSQVLTLEW
jgi:hypothetical protein